MRIVTSHLCWVIGLIALSTGCSSPETQEITDPAGLSAALPKETIALSTGISMAYQDLGAKDGAPVIFLHGYTDTGRSFRPTADALLAAEPDLHVLLLDQRGHGGSSMPPASGCAAAPEQCFRPADMADDVIAFMDQQGIDAATIVGHSMGSFVAQEIGLLHPDRVSALVLIGTAAKVSGNFVLEEYILAEPIEGSWKAGFEAQGLSFPEGVYDLTPLDAKADAMSWIEQGWVTDPTADPAFLARIAPETAATRMGAWIGAARALAEIDNTERLAELTMPTLVLWATQDAFFYETDQADLRDAFDTAVSACRMSYHLKQYGKRPLSEMGVQIDDIGHNTQWGAPHEVAADLASFLTKGEPTKDWYYSIGGDPQTIATEPGNAPLTQSKPAGSCP